MSPKTAMRIEMCANEHKHLDAREKYNPFRRCTRTACHNTDCFDHNFAQSYNFAQSQIHDSLLKSCI